MLQMIWKKVSVEYIKGLNLLDILEFETYDSAPMEPSQSFDLVSELGRDGEPDPAMIQFLRLVKLGTKDAFLLESVFRKLWINEWGYVLRSNLTLR